MWFLGEEGNKTSSNAILLGSISPSGTVTELPPLAVPGGGLFSETGLVSGPAGSLWFGYTNPGTTSDFVPAHHRQSFIGEVTTAGVVTTREIPSLGYRDASIQSLAVGGDGNLWFTESSGWHTLLGKMTPSDAFSQVPLGRLRHGAVANGPADGVILVGQNVQNRNEVFHVTTAGAITRLKIPARASHGFAASEGPADGSLWFVNNGHGAITIGRIAPNGQAASYLLPIAGPRNTTYMPNVGKENSSMAVGADGNLYFLTLADPASRHIMPRSAIVRVAPTAP